MTAFPSSPMTLEDVLVLQEMGIDCELIRGELRIRGTSNRIRYTPRGVEVMAARGFPQTFVVESMGDETTARSFPHSLAMMNLGYLLRAWLEGQPRPRGVIIGGEARVRIRQEPEMIVGIDLAYLSAALVAQTAKDAKLVNGAPVLAVEILSPTDTMESRAQKVADYLSTGVPLVWEVNPYYETVTVHRPDGPPVSFNAQQELTAEPHLPGLKIAVAEIFAT